MPVCCVRLPRRAGEAVKLYIDEPSRAKWQEKLDRQNTAHTAHTVRVCHLCGTAEWAQSSAGPPSITLVAFGEGYSSATCPRCSRFAHEHPAVFSFIADVVVFREAQAAFAAADEKPVKP